MTDEQLDLLRRIIQSEIEYEFNIRDRDDCYPNNYSDKLWDNLKETFKNDQN